MATITSKSSSAFDRDVAPSTAVVQTVTEQSDQDVLDLPPLNDVVDPDALDGLFSGRDTIGSVNFEYAGYHVTVHADRTVELYESA
jgi:hypothetical protein